MNDQTTTFQAKIYFYDLQNCAREFGFKADESWAVSMVSKTEKNDLEKRYFPTLSAQALPEMLSEIFGLVKIQLNQPLKETEKNIDAKQIKQQSLQYLVAYNAKRPRN